MLRKYTIAAAAVLMLTGCAASNTESVSKGKAESIHTAAIAEKIEIRNEAKKADKRAAHRFEMPKVNVEIQKAVDRVRDASR